MSVYRTGYNAMAFQTAPNCAEAVVGWSLAGAPMKNILTFERTAGYTLVDLENLANAVDTWWAAQVKPLTSNQCTYDGTLVRGLELENDQTAFDASGVGIGGNSSPACPANAAACITHRSAFTGRSARGRTYFGGFGVNQVGNAQGWIGTLCPALADTFIVLRAAVALSGWSHVVISRFAQGVKRNFAITFLIVTSVARNGAIDHIDGRLLKGH